MKPFAKNYIPSSMSFSEGFMSTRFIPKGTRRKILDIKKLNELLKTLKNVETVRVGLDGDFDCNSITVMIGKKIGKLKLEKDEYISSLEKPFCPSGYMCQGSMWASPIALVTYTDKPSEAYKVYKYGEESTADFTSGLFSNL